MNDSSTPHATTASPKPSCRAPWWGGGDDAVFGRGNAGWTTSKSGHCCPCQNCSQWPPAEKTGIESLLNRPSCPPDDPIGQGTELNCIRVLHSPATVTTLYNIPVPFCTDCVCVCVCVCVRARASSVRACVCVSASGTCTRTERNLLKTYFITPGTGHNQKLVFHYPYNIEISHAFS